MTTVHLRPPPFPAFKNEPFRDFSEEVHRHAMSLALEDVERRRGSDGFTVRPIIDGVTVECEKKIERTDPSDTSNTLATIHLASLQTTERALFSLREGFPRWRARSSEQRVAILRRVAQAMREQKGFLSAVIVREVGKPWKEADADVAEAIDFCDYYALMAESVAHPQLTEKVLGEENSYFYQPRGIVGVVSPWNFPLAITCGMTVAALVMGNAVALKPAEQSSVIGAEFARILLESGVPSSAFSFLPGLGEVVGRHLVTHPDVAMIAFTGSRAVGFEIIKSAGEIRPGQRCIKRVVAELGGKNCIIVDEDADMDDAIRGILHSAFGFAGQKCSACSRVVVVGSAYEPLLQRLAAATRDLIIGKAADPSSFLGPVVDEESYLRILDTIQLGKSELALLTELSIPQHLAGKGYYVPPTIFKDVPTEHILWKEEIFGPVVACTKVATFEQALKVATDSVYALTGGVFSRHPGNIAKAKEEFRVGNLYINRSITGALVGRQPFGGFGFSGIGSKAGGPDYLLQFVEPRVITENTMRRGFTPDL